MRRLIGTLVGVALAIAVIDAGWHVVGAWFPSPPDDIFGADDSLPSIMTMAPAGLAILAIGWFAAGFVGAFAGLRITQWRPAGWMVASVVVLIGFWNATQVFEPNWLSLASIVAPFAGAWLAERHFHRARPGDPLIG